MSWLSHGSSALTAVLAGVAAFGGYALFRLATAQSARQRVAASVKLSIALAVGLLAGLFIEVRSLVG
jgi:hypothetical protein